MRGSAMGFGALLIITAVCLLEVVSGNASLPYVIGALGGGLGCGIYGFLTWGR